MHTKALDRWFLTTDLSAFCARQALPGSCLLPLGVGRVGEACILIAILAAVVRSIYGQREGETFP